MTDAVSRFTEAAEERGFVPEIVVMSHSTHTAVEAAAAIGCEVGAIVKSLVLLGDGKPLLALVSGPNRVDLNRLSEVLGVEVTMSDAKTVKLVTGYSIGGVPPFGHTRELRTIIDSDLASFETVWAAAGSSTSVFGITPDDLIRLTAGEVTVIT